MLYDNLLYPSLLLRVYYLPTVCLGANLGTTVQHCKNNLLYLWVVIEQLDKPVLLKAL